MEVSFPCETVARLNLLGDGRSVPRLPRLPRLQGFIMTSKRIYFEFTSSHHLYHLLVMDKAVVYSDVDRWRTSAYSVYTMSSVSSRNG